MAYKFFDKKYLVMPDDRSIIGKRVFYADHIQDLIKDVESGDLDAAGIIEYIDIGSCVRPFTVRGADNNNPVEWDLIYYDPNYEAKVAYSQGRQIQISINGTDVWTDAVVEPVWDECAEYRVKPDTWYVHSSADEYGNCIGQPFYKDTDNKKFVEFEGTEEECDAWIAEHTPKTRRMTNKELARWLTEGKGQRVDVITRYVSSHYVYTEGFDNEKCDEDIRIRAWDENEWHEPLVEAKE